MNTPKTHRIAFPFVTLAACALSALAACSSASSSTATQRPRASDTSDPRKLAAPAPAPRRAPPPQLLVNYSPAGNVTVISSAPPTVAQLPSGAWQVTFARTIITPAAQPVADATR